MEELEFKKKAKQLNTSIKMCFGSRAAFCRVAELEDYELQLFFANCRQKMTDERVLKLAELNKTYHRLSGGKSNYFLTSDLKAKIKEAIDRRGGIPSVAMEVDGFSYNDIWDVIERNKVITTRIKRLLDHLGVDYGQ